MYDVANVCNTVKAIINHVLAIALPVWHKNESLLPSTCCTERILIWGNQGTAVCCRITAGE